MKKNGHSYNKVFGILIESIFWHCVPCHVASVADDIHRRLQCRYSWYIDNILVFTDEWRWIEHRIQLSLKIQMKIEWPKYCRSPPHTASVHPAGNRWIIVCSNKFMSIDGFLVFLCISYFCWLTLCIHAKQYAACAHIPLVWSPSTSCNVQL